MLVEPAIINKHRLPQCDVTTATGQTVGNKTRVEREEEELVGWEIVGHPRDIKKGTVSRQHPEREREERGEWGSRPGEVSYF